MLDFTFGNEFTIPDFTCIPVFRFLAILITEHLTTWTCIFSLKYPKHRRQFIPQGAINFVEIANSALRFFVAIAVYSVRF
ncbi:MAG: hypothetical protein HOD92_09445 [Deltaproteobacteria bacterium]|nr:hypothetical protein [Deltaproteobacteria bacterium]